MNEPHAQLTKRLHGYRREVVIRLLVRRSLTVAATVLLLWALLAAAFALFPWTILPWAWHFSAAGGAAAFAAVLMYTVVIRPFGLYRAVSLLETQGNERHPLLHAALQVGHIEQAGVSTALRTETVRRALDSLSHYPRHIDGFPVVRQLAVFGASALLFAAATLLSPNILGFLDLPFAGGYQAAIAPGTLAVPRGASVRLALRPHSASYPSCRLGLRAADGSWKLTRMLRPDSTGAFAYRADSLTESLIYRFSLGPHAFPAETVTVVPPPSLFALRVHLKPPRYTRRPARTLPDGQGNFTAYVGSRAELSIAASHPLAEARLRYGKDTVELDIDSSGAHGTLIVRRSGAYTFAFVDTFGQASDTAPSFYVEAIPDEPPLVQFLRPAANKALTPAQQESLLVEGIDDIGIKGLELQWTTSRDDSVDSRDYSPRKGHPPVLRTAIDWHLTPLGLYPGDTVFYWARITDTKPYGAPGTAVSDTFWLRVPGFDEIHRQMASRSERAEEKLEEVHKSQEKLGSELTEIVRSAANRRELTWEEKQVLQDVQKELESQRDSLVSAMQDLQQTVEAMREKGLETQELARKMDEVRKAVEELVEEYGDSLLFNLEEAQKDLDVEDVTEALRKMEELLPEMAERLEQALKYLDMLRRDQELASLAQQFQETAEHQQQVCSMSDSARQRKRQSELLKAIENLSGQTRKRMQPGDNQMLSPGAVPSLRKVDSLTREMTAMSKMSSGQCQAMRNQMTASLLSTSEEISSQMSSAMMQRMQAEQKRMLDMVHDALALAEWQNEQAGTAASSEDIPTLVRTQQALREALRKSMHKLDSLTMVSPQMLQDVVASYDAAGEAMARAESRLESSNAAAPMAEAAAGLRGAAQAMLAARDGMMSGQSGGSGGAGSGFMGMMRKLSGRQAAINAATGDILKQLLQGAKPGGTQQGGSQMGGEGEAMADARAEARQAQKALADQLRKLAEEYGEKAGPGGKKRMKELEQEARRLARLLEKPTDALRERQDRFLARMLQTTLSLHREEQGKEERKSRSASVTFTQPEQDEQPQRFSDTDIYYRLRRRALHGNIPPSYRMAVKAYFDSLGVLYLRNE